MGWYFKRELFDGDSDMKPISFSIPREKIRPLELSKSNLIAPLVPGVSSTFIYDNEKDYYDMYADSMFGLTWKKAGWDCLRHYEILAAGCIPLFVDISWCPTTIMVPYPKLLAEKVFALPGLTLPFSPMQDFKYTKLFISNVDFSKIEFDPSGESLESYEILRNELHEYTKKHLTTEAIARYIIDTVTE
jgi:hypothetical protein